MRTFLVLEGAKRLEDPGGDYAILPGSVMGEAGLIAWAARTLGTPADAPFLTVADAVKAAGIALFGLPTRDVRRDDPEVETVEATAGGRTILVIRRKGDAGGSARVRWQGDDGGTREVEVPGFLADALAGAPGSPAIASDAPPTVEASSDASDAPGGPGEGQGEPRRKSRRRKAVDDS